MPALINWGVLVCVCVCVCVSVCVCVFVSNVSKVNDGQSFCKQGKPNTCGYIIRMYNSNHIKANRLGGL